MSRICAGVKRGISTKIDWKLTSVRGDFFLFCECERSNNNLNYIISDDSIIIVSENDLISQLKPIIFRHHTLHRHICCIKKIINITRWESLKDSRFIGFFSHHKKKTWWNFPKQNHPSNLKHFSSSILHNSISMMRLLTSSFSSFPIHKKILHFNIFSLTFFVLCLNSRNEKLI